MTKSIEEQAEEAYPDIMGISQGSYRSAYVNGAKARDVQWLKVVKGLETLYYNNPNVRQDAYNQGVRDCVARLTKADEMLKEMGIK